MKITVEKPRETPSPQDDMQERVIRLLRAILAALRREAELLDSLEEWNREIDARLKQRG